ncbi:MAG TPA: hypothetical protein VJV78_39620, partial [Polyangiales bacterium]|nr:hypothetical protein [Polyangiales bacterium]
MPKLAPVARVFFTCLWLFACASPPPPAAPTQPTTARAQISVERPRERGVPAPSDQPGVAVGAQ